MWTSIKIGFLRFVEILFRLIPVELVRLLVSVDQCEKPQQKTFFFQRLQVPTEELARRTRQLDEEGRLREECARAIRPLGCDDTTGWLKRNGGRHLDAFIHLVYHDFLFFAQCSILCFGCLLSYWGAMRSG